MISYLWVGIIFFIALMLHVAVHRVLLTFKVKTIATNVVYVLGLMAMVYMWNMGYLVFPLASCLIYILLSFFISYFYMTLFLGGETPSSMILESFRFKKRQTYTQMTQLFSEKGLVWNRIDDLILAGLVTHLRGRYFVTRKGSWTAGIIAVYEFIFHRSLRG